MKTVYKKAKRILEDLDRAIDKPNLEDVELKDFDEFRKSAEDICVKILG